MFIEFDRLPIVVLLQLFVDLLMEHITNMFMTAVKLSTIDSKINNLMTENNIELPVEQPVKTRTKEDIENEIQELYEKMKTDKENRIQILENINQLEKELESIKVVEDNE
jgi:hypothetical protein